MVTEAGKELLRNTINTAKFHNRILEENEMWKQWELECGLTMMVSDDDIIKRIKKDHQCSKHRRRDKSRSRDSSRSKHEMSKDRQGAGSSNDRWDHSGFAELYPDAAVPAKYPSSSSTLDKHKKKKKSHHRSNSSDKEIWEEFKRPAEIWNKEKNLRLIELLRNAPALWNKNYRGYEDRNVKLKEIERIASKLHVDEKKITAQIDFLINEFHKKHQKITETRTKFSESEWFAYDQLTFLLRNERKCKTIEDNLGKPENPIWVDSSDSYSESEDESSASASTNQSSCVRSKVQNEKSDERRKKDKDPPYIEAYKAKKDSFSLHGEIMDYRMREAKKRSKVIARAESEDESSASTSTNQSSCVRSKVQNEKSEELRKKDRDTCKDPPYIQAYKAKKDRFSLYGETVADRMREANKSSKVIARAEMEIDFVLRKLETGLFDSP